ncbi:MAG: helix-turn-helix transcriptional regulator [Candidatus Binatia bacterium]
MVRATTESDLYPLIEAVYRASTQPGAWQDFLTLLRSITESDASVLHLQDARAARGSVTWASGIPPGLVDGYENWGVKNPHLAAVASRMETGFIMPNTPVRRSDYERSEYFNEFIRHHLPLYATCGTCIYTHGPQSLFLATDRVLGRPDFDTRHARLMGLLLPHVQQAMTIHRRLAEVDLQQMTQISLLNQLDFGVLLLSERGKVLVANEAAELLLAQRDTVSLTLQGYVTTVEEEGRAKLEALIASACGMDRRSVLAVGGAMRIVSSGTRSPLEIMVSPLRLRDVPFANPAPKAALFLRDPERSCSSLLRLQQLFHLTVAEARVAQLLVSGQSVSESADLLQIQLTTARTHVRRLLEKTGAKSISDLTRRLVSLPVLEQ